MKHVRISKQLDNPWITLVPVSREIAKLFSRMRYSQERQRAPWTYEYEYLYASSDRATFSYYTSP
eukprot:scaffold127768_cov33-Prasinocladus_malaysianus.AAC.1